MQKKTNIRQKKVNGLIVYFINSNAFKIECSHQITNPKKMKIIIEKIFKKFDTFIQLRDIDNYVKQWVLYNRLFDKNILKYKTGNCLFKEKNSIIKNLIINIFGYYRKEHHLWKKKKKQI